MANDEERVRKKIAGESKRTKPKPCRTRTDKLAIPHKSRVLALYKCHANHLTKARVELIKRMLQELYAMTPEETARYFQEADERARQAEMRKKLKRMLRREYRKQKHKVQADCAYRFVYCLLVRAMQYATRHPIPPLVCVRFRNLSDLVLEQLCDLRNLDHPVRDDPEKIGLFMITISDWFSIAIEIVYYVVTLKKNLELEELGRQAELDQLRGKFTSKSDISDLGEMEGCMCPRE